MLKIHTLPETGGDTLWASGYEVYDRLSPEMAAFLERLTATHDATFFHDEARRLGNPLRKGIRGSPLNHGEELTAVHPVIRTNRTYPLYKNITRTSLTVFLAVTGWKSVYVNKGFTKRINGVTKDESDVLLQYLFNVSESASIASSVLRLFQPARHTEPRCTGPLQMAEERYGDLG
jgi:alpha-ketoglutarate-dependent taurine dioxygenase